MTWAAQTDSTQSSQPRHPHSFRNQSHLRPARQVLFVSEAFGLSYSSQACLAHFEPSHGFDCSMTKSPAKMFLSTLAMKTLLLNRRKPKGSHLLHYANPN
jgi:hypothetical protein